MLCFWSLNFALLFKSILESCLKRTCIHIQTMCNAMTGYTQALLDAAFNLYALFVFFFWHIETQKPNKNLNSIN